MKVLQVITGLQRAAGTSVFCGEIANQLVANGHECIIVLPYINQEEKYQVDARVKVISKAELKKSKWVPDVVHIHGLWSPQLHFMVQLAKQYKTPIVWSPHGMLAPWALRHKWFKKKLSWVLWQKRDLQRAKLFHVTSSEESQWIHSLGFSQSTSIVPLGTSMPRRGAQHDITTKTILFVGRIYPVKGLVNLIKAFAMLRKDAQWSDWRVVIVGPNQAGHQEELELLAQELGLVTVRDSFTSNSSADILFSGVLFGVEKDNAYCSASCFVLPSFTENFGGVVIDALSFGVPVLASVATPWGELEKRGCGGQFALGVDPLAEALRRIMMLSDNARKEMGIRGRKLVEEYYTWDAVGRRMIGAYQTLMTQMNRGVLVNAKK